MKKLGVPTGGENAMAISSPFEAAMSGDPSRFSPLSDTEAAIESLRLTPERIFEAAESLLRGDHRDGPADSIDTLCAGLLVDFLLEHEAQQEES